MRFRFAYYPRVADRSYFAPLFIPYFIAHNAVQLKPLTLKKLSNVDFVEHLNKSHYNNTENWNSIGIIPYRSRNQNVLRSRWNEMSLSVSSTHVMSLNLCHVKGFFVLSTKAFNQFSSLVLPSITSHKFPRIANTPLHINLYLWKTAKTRYRVIDNQVKF